MLPIGNEKITFRSADALGGMIRTVQLGQDLGGDLQGVRLEDRVGGGAGSAWPDSISAPESGRCAPWPAGPDFA